MGLFSRKTDTSPEEQEYRDAKRALASDPVNSGRLGYVDIDSPAGRANLAAQDRVREAEKAVKQSRKRNR